MSTSSSNKALVGFCNNIAANFPKIKVWSQSFKKHTTGDVFLICANATPDELQACKSIGIEATTVEVPHELTGYLYHKRLGYILEWLKSATSDFILSTDVFDVVFQGDPFSKLDFEKYEVFAGSEGVRVEEEPWNRQNVGSLFPEQAEICKWHDVVCSGIIAGRREALVEVYSKMHDLCENHSTDQHAIKDQAALIVLLATGEIPKFKLFQLNDAWVIHCAVAGPTYFFEHWGFRNRLLERNSHIPYIENDVVKSNGTPFDIVHQFNRVPEWHEPVTKAYV